MSRGRIFDHLNPDDHPEAKLFSRVARSMVEAKDWDVPPSDWTQRPAPEAVAGEIEGR